jgi:hypothetical protein
MEDEVAGADLAETVWEMLETPRASPGTVLLYDGLGTITGAASAEMLAEQGAQLVYVTPDKQAGIETSYLDRPFIMRELYRAGTVLHPDRRLKRIARTGNRIEATFVNEYTEVEETMACDRLVIERGTIPMDELYHEMRSGSVNDGVTDLDTLVAGGRQALSLNPEGSYELHRIGDAISSRDIHAAMLDAMRLCKDI